MEESYEAVGSLWGSACAWGRNGWSRDGRQTAGRPRRRRASRWGGGGGKQRRGSREAVARADRAHGVRGVRAGEPLVGPFSAALPEFLRPGRFVRKEAEFAHGSRSPGTWLMGAGGFLGVPRGRTAASQGKRALYSRLSSSSSSWKALQPEGGRWPPFEGTGLPNDLITAHSPPPPSTLMTHTWVQPGAGEPRTTASLLS